MVPNDRPRQRGECGTERPCPWVSCRHHLLLEHLGSRCTVVDITSDEAIVEYLTTMKDTCSLDLTERGGMLGPEIADALGISRQWVSQIEERAMWKLKHRINEGTTNEGK